jgi:hypothetical protein
MTILLIIVGILILVMIIPLFMRNVHHAQREKIVHVPAQKAFDYLKMIGNHDQFNKWAKAGERKEEFKGTDGTVGFISSWSGNKDAGQGEKEIKNLVNAKLIEIEIRFVKPFTAVAQFKITTESLPGDQTKVTWSNTSSLKYPLNIFVPIIERSLAKDMDQSLDMLKCILEKQWGPVNY